MVRTSLGASASAKSFRAPDGPAVKRKNGVPSAPPWHVAPSALNGLAVQVDEIGARWASSPTNADPAFPLGASTMKRAAVAPPSKWPTNVTKLVPICSCHEMYGVLPANV